MHRRRAPASPSINPSGEVTAKKSAAATKKSPAAQKASPGVTVDKSAAAKRVTAKKSAAATKKSPAAQKASPGVPVDKSAAAKRVTTKKSAAATKKSSASRHPSDDDNVAEESQRQNLEIRWSTVIEAWTLLDGQGVELSCHTRKVEAREAADAIARLLPEPANLAVFSKTGVLKSRTLIPRFAICDTNPLPAPASEPSKAGQDC